MYGLLPLPYERDDVVDEHRNDDSKEQSEGEDPPVGLTLPVDVLCGDVDSVPQGLLDALDGVVLNPVGTDVVRGRPYVGEVIRVRKPAVLGAAGSRLDGDPAPWVRDADGVLLEVKVEVGVHVWVMPVLRGEQRQF